MIHSKLKEPTFHFFLGKYPTAPPAGAGQLFSAQMGKWRTAIARSMCWAIFSRYCGQRIMTNKGAKRNIPHLLQAQQAPVCLWSISDMLQCQKFHGIVTKSTVSSRVCWSLKVLWGSVSTFPTVSSRRKGEKRKKDTGLTGRVNESK